MYYRYWMNRSHHNVAAHYGIRTRRYKLIYYYADGLGQEGADGTFCGRFDQEIAIDACDLEPEWELFDLEADPQEMHNVYDDPAYADVVRDLTDQLHRLQAELGAARYEKDVD